MQKLKRSRAGHSVIQGVKPVALHIDTVTEVNPSMGVCTALQAMPQTPFGRIVINGLIVFIIGEHIGPNRYFIGWNQYCPTARYGLNNLPNPRDLAA